MWTNSLKISDTTKTEFIELNFFESDQKTYPNYYRADFSSFGSFNMVAHHKSSDRGIFRYLSNHAFCSLKVRKYISLETYLFFQNV